MKNLWYYICNTTAYCHANAKGYKQIGYLVKVAIQLLNKEISLRNTLGWWQHD
ncbi:hypothetical protein [Metabacillus endolithicus]|uniref:hypothetical protein n=1 Tax=Metabacillus endolithicus TaxID=1535204 RepID=UPI00366C306F